MFAVIKIAGQQFRVKEGESLYVPHLEGKNGDKIEFNDIMLLSNEDKLDIENESKLVVKAEILNEVVKDDKVIAFKMKRRKGFRKKHGHRTHFTKIRIESIA